MARKTIQQSYVLNLREAHTLCVLYAQGALSMGTLLDYMRHTYATEDVNALDLLFDVIGGWIMARGGKPVTQEEPKQWTRFVDIPLGGRTKEDVYEHYRDASAVSLDCESLLNAGYRLGFAYNERSRSYIVSVTCRADDGPNKGCTFSAHGPDWYTALMVALYKHYVVCGGDWSEGSTTPLSNDIG